MKTEPLIVAHRVTPEGVVLALNIPARLKTGVGSFSEVYVSWDKIGSALFQDYGDWLEIEDRRKIREQWAKDNPSDGETPEAPTVDEKGISIYDKTPCPCGEYHFAPKKEVYFDGDEIEDECPECGTEAEIEVSVEMRYKIKFLPKGKENAS